MTRALAGQENGSSLPPWRTGALVGTRRHNTVDAADIGTDGLPWPRWVIEFAGSDARVRFLDRHTALWRRVDYEAVDGRLWRKATYDYTYPDESRRWEHSPTLVRPRMKSPAKMPLAKSPSPL